MTQVEMRHGDECPNCTGFLWRQGPRAGISQNMECVGCRSRYNMSFLEGDTETVIVIEEITSEAEGGGRWRTQVFPEVAQ